MFFLERGKSSNNTGRLMNGWGSGGVGEGPQPDKMATHDHRHYQRAQTQQKVRGWGELQTKPPTTPPHHGGMGDGGSRGREGWVSHTGPLVLSSIYLAVFICEVGKGLCERERERESWAGGDALWIPVPLFQVCSNLGQRYFSPSSLQKAHHAKPIHSLFLSERTVSTEH